MSSSLLQDEPQQGDAEPWCKEEGSWITLKGFISQ